MVVRWASTRSSSGTTALNTFQVRNACNPVARFTRGESSQQLTSYSSAWSMFSLAGEYLKYVFIATALLRSGVVAGSCSDHV